MDEKIRNKSLSNGKLICANCGVEIIGQTKMCPFCGWVNTKSIAKNEENQCGNCHAYMNPEDKYCPVCGTKAGEGAFAPSQNLMECIYGPRPVERTHICKRCRHKWVTCLMLDQENHCPKCGGYAPPRDSEKKSWKDLFRFRR